MKRKRNYGIDLLRIVAMFMIVVLHVLGAGGVIYNFEGISPVYIAAWLLEFAAYCAVNCYALISGYVGVESKFRLSNIMLLWLQVFATTIVITILFGLVGISVSGHSILESCMPLTSNLYWYFTAYVCLYLLTPFLNQFVASLDKRRAKYLLLILIVLFSFVPTFLNADLFYVRGGYSALWLIVLYIIGGVIYKYETEIKIKTSVLVIMYIGSVLVTLLSKLAIEFLEGRLPFRFYESNFLMNYNSPTIILAGVSLLLLFSRLRVEKWKKLISYIAPLTFGIYIIHSHPLVWDEIIVNRFVVFTTYHPIKMILSVILSASVIFFVCALVEYVRAKLFRMVHVIKLLKFIEAKILTLFENFLKFNKRGEI